MTPTTLLITKLSIPQSRPDLVARPHLVERMNVGLEGNVTLVSAPAGYGKTTLASDWVSNSQVAAAWISLDKSDNNIGRFFSYLITALQGVHPDIGSEILPVLESGSRPVIEHLLTVLVNDMVKIAANFVLILDDYHVINNISIHQALDFFIDHIPPCLHLVILTREDPPMPLGRLRVQQQLTEVREADLRFTLEETSSFMNELMGLALSAEDVKKLKSRTEGWIAGLQLCAMNLQGHTDKHERILAFSGSHHHLIDYLIPEVLNRQSAEVQSFLLSTSILEQFNVSLCESLLPGTDGKEMLLTLEKANLFLIALDERRIWYRYHHLFDDFLQQRLRSTTPEIIPELYGRACKWYEANGMVDQAIEYALAGRDAMQAARLLDEHIETYILANADVSKVLSWASKLPAETRAIFPRLCIYHAMALLTEYQLDAVEPVLALAEAGSANPAERSEEYSERQVTDFANLIRAHVARQRGDYEVAVQLSLTGLETLPEGKADRARETLILQGALTINLGMAHFNLGHVASACRFIEEALPLNQQCGNRFAALGCIEYLMMAEIACGKLGRAQAMGTKGLRWIEEWSRSEGVKRRPVRSLAHLRRRMSGVLYEINDLDRAAGFLKKATEYYELTQSWTRLRSYVLLFDLEQAKGNLESALGYLEKLKHFSLKPGLVFHDIPLDRQIAERNLLLSQLQPELVHLFSEAVDWAESSGLEPSDSFRYEQEYEYLTLARILIAQPKTEEAIPLLDRLIQSAEIDGRWGDLIPRLALQAMAYHAQHRSDTAVTFLARALRLAEAEGYIRTFVDLGPQMCQLLQVAAERGVAPAYAPTLLAAFPTRPFPGRYFSTVRPSPRSPLPVSLVEPLTDREVQILRLMAARLSYREIADELYLSVNTVKWYAKNIYGKLGASSKADAAYRARELGLL